MMFRDFFCQNFGFIKGYTQKLTEMERSINVAQMDCFLHPMLENYNWDARFEVFE